VPLHREMTLWSLVSQLLSSYQKKSPDVVVRTFLYLFHRIVLQIALLRLRSIKRAVIVKRVIHNECKCKCISRKKKCLYDFFVGLIQSFINITWYSLWWRRSRIYRPTILRSLKNRPWIAIIESMVPYSIKTLLLQWRGYYPIYPSNSSGEMARQSQSVLYFGWCTTQSLLVGLVCCPCTWSLL
jgi:hypothetical protein